MSDNTTSAWLQPASSAAIAATQAITRGGPKRQFKWNKKLMQEQNKMNRENAEWVLAQNRALAQEQRDYDSPKAQMQRYKDANLNPNLVYGQGTPGNMGSPVSVGSLPGANAGQVDSSWPDVAGSFQGAQLAQTQMGLTNQKIEESQTKQELTEAQTNLVNANPYMRPAYVEALVKQLEATAALKDQEAQFQQSWTTDAGGTRWQRGYLKMQAELDTLIQKYNLSKVDQEVKARIIEGKEWENDLKEIQSKWMKEGDITPQHIYQGLMMLLMKLR